MTVLLQVNAVCKAYGASIILENASAAFGDDQKIGVIGRNGAGKSTLCRIITGHETADSGAIIKNSVLKLSYLEQHDSFRPEETVVDFLMRTTGSEHWECAQVSARFNITNEMLEAPVRSLPGGYQTRVKLSAMLLGDPNFLVLDEPSNYLDLNTLILLENFLLDFRGGFLVVSHDREFLKRTCDHTLEVEGGELTLYPGNIEEYFEFKGVQTAQIAAHNRGVEKKREQLQAFIDRFRAKASTASRAQSKMKQLSKLKTIEIAHPMSHVKIPIPPVESKAGIAFSCEGLTIGYPGKDVASGIEFEIDRGCRVAVLGDNGEGKTTLLRTMSGDLAPKRGSFRWGTGLKIAFYAQHVFS
ncbi:MAG TPA: ATP-binding cassette domain-containing protein, partial [Candidatus Omnitrophota bacterium]|nr:ATP-binding cassette domain-containing protein [Candidatus Omnitrophota bacterium]